MPSQKPSDSVGKDILFDAVFGKSSEGIFLVCFNGLIERANPAVSVLLGYSLSELEGRNMLELLHVNDRHKRAVEIQNMLDGKIDCIRATRTFISNIGRSLSFSIRSYLVHKNNNAVRILTFIWPIDADPVTLTDSLEARIQQLEGLLNRYGKPEEWKTMVNNIHLGDEIGGDNVGRDKTINSAKVFYFIAAVLAGIVSLLAYLGYVITFPNHEGRASPPQHMESPVNP